MAVELGDLQYRVVVAVASAAAVLLLANLRLCGDLSLPPKPPKPEPTVESARAFVASVERSTGAYAAYLERDARNAGLRVIPTPSTMSQVFPAQRDDVPRVLEPGDAPIEILDLEIELLVEPVPARGGRNHMVLRIENRSDHHLAYRVDTRPTRGLRACRKKRDLAHDAIAIAPGEELRRSECIHRKGYALEIRGVETVELPELAYLYVSAVDPQAIGVDRRTSAGHRPAIDKLACRLIKSAAVDRGLDSGRVTWRDLIDFYARHRCKTYRFPVGYEAFQRDGERSLPAVEGSP